MRIRTVLVMASVLLCLCVAACAHCGGAGVRTQVRGQYDVTFGTVR